MAMKLTRRIFQVDGVVFGERTALCGGRLVINKQELVELVLTVPGVARVDVELVSPGESARIIHVLDTIQPQLKLAGGDAYPGILTGPGLVGNGITNVLSNVAVMECAALPWNTTGLMYAREAIVDMTGPIAGFTPFSGTFNVVLRMNLVEGKSDPEYDTIVRMAGMKVAARLAETTRDREPASTEEYDLESRARPGLPNIAYVYQVQNQGTYSNTLLYGKSVDNLVPTPLHPNEMLDGALVSGNYVWPAFKIPSFIHANAPVLEELYRGHGVTHNFVGVVLSRGHNYSHFEKVRSANFAVKLVQSLKADGMIITWEGGGNAATDAMLTIQAAERTGIKCTALCFEFGGPDGTEGILLVDDVPEATALVSGGSIEKPVSLPAVERAAGGDYLRLGREFGGELVAATSALEFDTTTLLYCSGNQAGHSRLIGRAY
ncbi:MAG: glycine/sarcosine/betaine reductase component B subunit [Bacillota bacterium]